MTGDTTPTPLRVLLAAMQAFWDAGDLKAAANLARAAAPYLHARRRTTLAPFEHGFDAERLSDAELDALLDRNGSCARAKAEGTSSAEPD
jgi:hypothetical protein